MKKALSEGPIVVGLSGFALTGKTSTANKLVPIAKAVGSDTEEKYLWDHFVLASPLYELVTIKRKIEGNNRRDRQLFAIWDIVSTLLGSSSFEDTLDVVYHIYDQQIDPNEDVKPRQFMQDIGTLLREYNEDCFVNFLKIKIHQFYAQADKEDKVAIAVVSDIRLENEAKFINSYNNSILFKFYASRYIRDQRALLRDGFLLTDNQQSHVTELGVSSEFITQTIDTDCLSVEQQAAVTKQAIFNHFADL